MVDCSRIKIDVGVEILFLLHQLGDPLGHPDPLGFADFRTELHCHIPEVRGARIQRLVNAMADAHNFLLLRQLLRDVGIDVIFVPDFLEHIDDAFIGSSMKRTFERADGRGNGGVEISERGDSDASAESRCIHPVVGMEHKRDIESIGRFFCWWFARHQIKKMRGFAKVFTHLWERLSATRAMVVSGDNPDLGRDVSRPLFV